MALVVRAFLILFQIYFALATPPFVRGNIVPFIVGGNDANITDYPYQIEILVDNDHTCGGSILNNKFILTAAHCFLSINTSQVTVRVGSSYSTKEGEVIQAANITSHSGFNPSVNFNYENDVAIVELATNLTYSAGAAPTVLPSSTTTFEDGQASNATGWGLLTDSGPLSERLQVVTIPLITTETCQAQTIYSTQVTSKMFCAGEEGKSTCTGDSGGPLVSNGVQLGIVSWGGTCGGARTPAVYVKVSEYLQFIDDVISQSKLAYSNIL